MSLTGPPLAAPPPLHRFLETGVAAKPDAVLVATVDDALTWRQLDAHSNRLARNYLALGLKPGDRVGTVMPNRLALIVHHIACLKAGLVSTPFNYRYTPPEIDHALEVSGASLLVHHAERDGDIELCKLASHVPLGSLRYGADAGDARRLEPLLEEEPAQTVALPEPDPSAPFIIFFTSGSTGPAKGVTHTCETMAWCAATIAAGFKLSADDVFLTTSSHSYFGGTGFFFATMFAQAKLAMSLVFEPQHVFPLIRKERPTIAWMLPSTLFSLTVEGASTKEDFASFRFLYCAGDKASNELQRQFKTLSGFDVGEFYGLTETGGLTFAPPDRSNKPGSIGLVGPGVIAEVRDEAGKLVPQGEEGRLWVQTRSVNIGYWGRPDATAEVNKDGWFDTGDVVAVDADGYVWFRGRRKQIIIHDGSNIAPQEVEAALLEHKAVKRAGAVGVHDVQHGENVWAYVELFPGAVAPSMDELITFARQRVGYKAPDWIGFLDRVPTNAVGKTDRTILKKMAADTHGT